MSDSSLAMSRPVPTGRAVAVLAAGLLPAALAIANPRFGLSALGINRGVILLRGSTSSLRRTRTIFAPSGR